MWSKKCLYSSFSSYGIGAKLNATKIVIVVAHNHKCLQCEGEQYDKKIFFTTMRPTCNKNVFEYKMAVLLPKLPCHNVSTGVAFCSIPGYKLLRSNSTRTNTLPLDCRLFWYSHAISLEIANLFLQKLVLLFNRARLQNLFHISKKPVWVDRTLLLHVRLEQFQ